MGLFLYDLSVNPEFKIHIYLIEASMKKFLLAFVLISSAQAADVVIFDEIVPYLKQNDELSSKLFVDLKSGRGFGDIKATRTIEIDVYVGGAYYRTPVKTVVMNQRVEIQGLNLIGEKVMYNGIECGRYDESDILGFPDVQFNGNCQISTKKMFSNGEMRIQSLFTTK